jgi:surfeit locus 1 family protein
VCILHLLVFYRRPCAKGLHNSLTALPEFTYRKVMLKGIWDHEHAILVGPRVRDGTAGFHIITPLRRPNGSTVIVDRGFVSKEQAQAALRAHEPLGEVEVLGMLRTSQTRNNFTPDNHPEQGIWYWADVEAMTEHAGGTAAGVQPVFIEEIFGEFTLMVCLLRHQIIEWVHFVEGHSGEATARVQNAIPVGRAPSVDLPNSHLSYAVTWCVDIMFLSITFLI